MGLKVKQGKKESRFDRKRFANWLKKNYQLPSALARKVSRTTHQFIASEHKSIQAKELPGMASKLIGNSLAGIWNSKRTTNVPPVSLMAANLPSVGEASGLIASILEALINYFKERGWESDEPGSMILEQAGFIPPFDDQKAPEIGDITFSNPHCCTTDLGGNGVEIDITVPVTDTGGIGNSSGVKSVKVSGVHMKDGHFFLNPNKTKYLSEEEEELSEDELVAVTLSVCFPCEFIIDGCINLLIKVMDDDDNGRIVLTRVAIPKLIRSECCP